MAIDRQTIPVPTNALLDASVTDRHLLTWIRALAWCARYQRTALPGAMRWTDRMWRRELRTSLTCATVMVRRNLFVRCGESDLMPKPWFATVAQNDD